MEIPTLTQLYNNILADLETELSFTIPLFGKNFLRALAAVQAAKLKLYYLTLGRLQKNVFVDTADPESIGGTLERFGRVKLGRSPFPAVAGVYTVTVTGTSGATIPAETVFKSNDDSLSPAQLFVLDEAYTLPGTTGAISLRALESGLVSRLNIGDQLTATAPIVLVNSLATVTAETTAPLAAESVEDYRAKTIEAFRLEAQGGAASDYRLWSYDAQGVKTSYAYAKSNAPGEINLYVEATPADSTDGKGTAGPAILAEVEQVIQFDPDITMPLSERGRQPISVWQVHVQSVAVKEVAINIAGSSFTTAQQTTIGNALQSEVNKIRPFVAACDVLAEKNDILDTNKVIATILTVLPGSQFGAITITVAGSPTSSYTFAGGDIPYFDTVTFV